MEHALALRPQLLMRAYELTRHPEDAADLVQETYVVFVLKPPSPRSPAQLKHWLRTVMLNRRRQQRRLLARGAGDLLHFAPISVEVLVGLG